MLPREIYYMGLHEILNIDGNSLSTTIIRVPGGWVYHSYDKSKNFLGMVFVPFNNEFQDEL